METYHKVNEHRLGNMNTMEIIESANGPWDSSALTIDCWLLLEALDRPNVGGFLRFCKPTPMSYHIVVSMSALYYKILFQTNHSFRLMGFLQWLTPLAYPEVAETSSTGAAKAVAENSATRAKESKFLMLNRGILVSTAT